MSTKAYTNTLDIVECANCHMDFGVAQGFRKDRKKDHGTFYCPAGHRNFYPQKSDEEKLRDELAREKHCCEQKGAELRDLRATLPAGMRLGAREARKFAGSPQLAAYWKGFDAGRAGKPEEACPYESNRGGWRHTWIEGHELGALYAEAP